MPAHLSILAKGARRLSLRLSGGTREDRGGGGELDCEGDLPYLPYRHLYFASPPSTPKNDTFFLDPPELSFPLSTAPRRLSARSPYAWDDPAAGRPSYVRPRPRTTLFPPSSPPPAYSPPKPRPFSAPPGTVPFGEAGEARLPLPSPPPSPSPPSSLDVFSSTPPRLPPATLHYSSYALGTAWETFLHAAVYPNFAAARKTARRSYPPAAREVERIRPSRTDTLDSTLSTASRWSRFSEYSTTSSFRCRGAAAVEDDQRDEWVEIWI